MDALDQMFEQFLKEMNAPPDTKGIEFFNDSEYCMHNLNEVKKRFKMAAFRTLQHPNMALKR